MYPAIGGLKIKRCPGSVSVCYQQKAIKSVDEKIGISVRGYSIIGLIKGFESSFKIPEKFYSYARILSRYYLEVRYPNRFPEGAPMDYFDMDMARGGLDDAEKILE